MGPQNRLHFIPSINSRPPPPLQTHILTIAASSTRFLVDSTQKMCPTGTELARTVAKSNLRSAFDVIDGDGDGKISHADLRAFYGGATGSDDDVIVSMISAADSNRNGFVEYDEFERVLSGGEKTNKKKKKKNGVMEEAFRVMDKDGDGKVGLADLKSYLQWAGLEAGDDDVRAMIRLAGGDETGGVTFEGLLKILAV